MASRFSCWKNRIRMLPAECFPLYSDRVCARSQDAVAIALVDKLLAAREAHLEDRRKNHVGLTYVSLIAIRGAYRTEIGRFLNCAHRDLPAFHRSPLKISLIPSFVYGDPPNGVDALTTVRCPAVFLVEATAAYIAVQQP